MNVNNKFNKRIIFSTYFLLVLNCSSGTISYDQYLKSNSIKNRGFVFVKIICNQDFELSFVQARGGSDNIQFNCKKNQLMIYSFAGKPGIYNLHVSKSDRTSIWNQNLFKISRIENIAYWGDLNINFNYTLNMQITKNQNTVDEFSALSSVSQSNIIPSWTVE